MVLSGYIGLVERCVQCAPWLAQRVVPRRVAGRLYLALVCHPCVTVVKRLSHVIADVTYLEFLVLRFYLIYYHNDNHAKARLLWCEN